MACYLAPEKPWLPSATSEQYFRRLNYQTALPKVNIDQQHTRFGSNYERELCFYLAKHAEANSDDRLCIIGDEPQWASIIQEGLFLNKPIVFIDCQASADQGRSICSPEISGLFLDAIQARLAAQSFEQILLFQCLDRIYAKKSLALLNIIQRALSSNGKLIIIHRDALTSTLPFPSVVTRAWSRLSSNLSHLMEHLQADRQLHIDFSRETRTIQFTMKKLQWFRYLYDRSFYPVNLIDQTQMIDGLRRLNESSFKYHSGDIEMHDRLAFLTIPNQNEPFSPLPRYPANSVHSLGLLRSSSTMSITEAMQELSKLNQPTTKRNLFASTIRLI